MKVIAKKNRELNLINAQNTQNENRAETITLVVPEEYEDYNKKIVFILPNNTRVSDIITNNEYQITNAITQYEEVEFYIWLTKGNVDFRTKTKPLKFYHNENASNDITPEQIGLVNTVVNLLEEEIDKVENLDLDVEKIGTVATLTLTKKDGTTKEVEITDGQDGYTPQKGVDYFTEQDIEKIETDVKNDLEENVLVNYSLTAETGAKIELSINTTDYKLKAILKDKNNNIIHTSNVIDLPLETMVVNATYDNVNKAIILTLQNGTTVSISVADLVSGLVSESQLQTILSNYYTKTEINNLLNNKVDKVQGKELSSNDFTDTLKEKLEGLENYDDTEIKADISDIQDEQIEQNTDIEKLQTENARFKATLPTTGEVTGQAITLNKTAELEFKKPPLPMGNSEQVQYSGKQLIPFTNQDFTLNGVRHYVQNGTLYLNGTTTTETNQRNELYKSNFSMTLPAGTYYFKRGTSNIPMYIIKYDDNTNIITNEGQFTLEETTQVYFGIYLYQRTFNNEKIDCQLELGNSATSCEPYVGGQVSPNPDYPQEITNVTGDVEVVVENKNLAWNGWAEDFVRRIDNTLLANIETKDNRNCLRQGASAGWKDYDNKYIFKTNFKENTQYTLIFDLLAERSTQGNIGIEHTDGTVVEPSNLTLNAWNKVVLTSSPNKTIKYIRGVYRDGNEWIDLDTFMVYEGTEQIDFIPHKEQKFTFPLGNEKLMLGDYLADDGIHHVRGQVTESGTIVTLNDAKSGGAYLCSKKTSGNLVEKTLTFDEAITDALIEYELEEEVIVPYTSAQQTAYNQIKQALSYEGQTNISSNQNAIFNVKAYLDTKEVLDNKVDKVTGKGLSTNDFTNTYKNSVDSNTSARHTHTNKTVLDGIVSSDITNWNGKQNETDNSLNTTNKTITGAINEVYSIARGANQAKSYIGYSEMITALNSLDDDVYISGQIINIETLLIPDLWVYSVESTNVPYTYTTDEAITTALSTNGYIQVGYYKLSALETQKVDLTDYEQNTNKTTTISSSSTNAQYPSAKAVYDYIQSLDGDGVSY